MARIHTGRPNGRPPKAEKVGVVDFHANLPAEIMDKIDSLRQGNETRKDVIVRLVRDAASSQ